MKKQKKMFHHLKSLKLLMEIENAENRKMSFSNYKIDFSKNHREYKVARFDIEPLMEKQMVN